MEEKTKMQLKERFIILKKGFVNELRALSIVVGLIAGIVILGSIIALVVNEIADSLPTTDATSVAWNVTDFGLKTFQNIFKQMPLLGTIIILLVIAAAALGIFAYFGGGGRKF